jgi:excisionase family DNA binding protein
VCNQVFSLELPEALFEALAERVAEIIEERTSRQQYAEIQGVAEYIGCSVRRVRDLRERGLPAKRIGRRLLFDLREVDAWIARQGWSEA